MKLVFPLNRDKILFPRVLKRNISPHGRDLFWQGKTLRQANIQNGRHKLEEKNGSVFLYLNISRFDTLTLCLVGGLPLLEI